jgi:hypothetical protein
MPWMGCPPAPVLSHYNPPHVCPLTALALLPIMNPMRVDFARRHGRRALISARGHPARRAERCAHLSEARAFTVQRQRSARGDEACRSGCGLCLVCVGFGSTLGSRGWREILAAAFHPHPPRGDCDRPSRFADAERVRGRLQGRQEAQEGEWNPPWNLRTPAAHAVAWQSRCMGGLRRCFRLCVGRIPCGVRRGGGAPAGDRTEKFVPVVANRPPLPPSPSQPTVRSPRLWRSRCKVLAPRLRGSPPLQGAALALRRCASSASEPVLPDKLNRGPSRGCSDGSRAPLRPVQQAREPLNGAAAAHATPPRTPLAVPMGEWRQRQARCAPCHTSGVGPGGWGPQTRLFGPLLRLGPGRRAPACQPQRAQARM